MTKFKKNQLVCLKRDVGYIEYSEYLKKLNLSDQSLERASKKENIKFVTGWSGANIKKGTTGIIKEYKHVYMLSYTTRSIKKIFSWSKDVKPPEEDDLISLDRSYAFCDTKNRKHTIILIDGKLIAFEDSSALENVEDTLKRADYEVVFETKKIFKNVTKHELNKFIKHVSSRGYKKELSAKSVVNIATQLELDPSEFKSKKK